MLLVSVLTLLFPGLLLDSTALFFSLDASLTGLKSLRLDELSISNFFVLLFLVLHNRQFSFLQHLHTRLLERLQAKHIQHWFDLFVKVEKFEVVVENLSFFAVFFRRHLRLEQWHRWPVEIELSCDAYLLSRWLVSQVFDILVSLEKSVYATWYRFWRWDVSIWIDRYDALRSLRT